MQIKNNRANILQNPWLIGAIKVVLLVGCLYFIFTKLQNQSFDLKEIEWPDKFWITVAFVSVLMILNWYLEALRWKISVKSFESISMSEAWRTILGGLALNWVLPFTSGDLVARIAQQSDKYKATAAAMLNRVIMLCFTLMLGLYGVNRLAISYEWNIWSIGLVLLGVVIGILVLRKRIRRFLIYFQELKRSTFLLITSISFIRYVVFVVQFYLLLPLFFPLLNAELIVAGIGWVFLVRSVLPLFFGGVGVREASGILFFEPYVADIQLIIVPIFLIWIINTVIPSIAGLIFIMRFKTGSDQV